MFSDAMVILYSGLVTARSAYRHGRERTSLDLEKADPPPKVALAAASSDGVLRISSAVTFDEEVSLLTHCSESGDDDVRDKRIIEIVLRF
jgi:hypothetical protein